MFTATLYPTYQRTKAYNTGELVAITQPNLAGLPIVYLFQALEPVNKYENPFAKTSKWKLIVNSANSTTDINQRYNNGTINPILTPTGIISGAYTNVNLTVDANGRIFAISNGSNGANPWNTINLINTDSPYTPANNSNFFFICDTTYGVIAINSSAIPKKGDQYNIINDAGNKNITFTPLSLLIGLGQTAIVMYDGVKWRILVPPNIALT